MAQSKVRTMDEKSAGARGRGADEDGRLAEAGYRELPHMSLSGAEKNFTAPAAALRRRLRSSVDSADAIRADCARDGAAFRIKAPAPAPTFEADP